MADRLLLSAKLVGTTLRIVGTASDDRIVVAANPRFINILTVGETDSVRHFALSAVTRIEIRTHEGNDKVAIDGSLDPLAWRAFVDGGAGDDTITTGAGRDTIYGGDGNDKIYANGGNDLIDSGTGKDMLVGGAGKDTITAGPHNDRVIGGSDNDQLDGGKGNDYLEGDEGDDLINDPAGTDTTDAGPGNDAGKLAGAGTLHGGDGNDAFTCVGSALMYGDGGADTLQGWWINGGPGNDTLNGLLGNDEIHGGSGDDLIRGFSGADVLLGDEGNDALFGGVDDDTLYGGDGDDNLYGTNGHDDTHKELAGRDDAYGQKGSDWFETDYHWHLIDRERSDQSVNTQVDLTQDPSNGKYLTGSLTSDYYYGSGAILTGNFNYTGSISGSDYTIIGGGVTTPTTTGTTISPTIQTKAFAAGGWLSTGMWDQTANKFVPPAMDHQTRMRAAPQILELPGGWTFGDPIAVRDDVVWYPVGLENPASPATAAATTPAMKTTFSNIHLTAFQYFTVGGPTGIIVDDTWLPPDGTYQWNGTKFLALSANRTPVTPPPIETLEPTYTVPTLAGTANVPVSAPHIYDGVSNGLYRFLGVHRGTVLVAGASGNPIEPTPKPLDTSLLLVPSTADLRVAGAAPSYHVSNVYDAVPTGGPKLRGILVDGGAIWLPTDGSAPYFSSGKN